MSAIVCCDPKLAFLFHYYVSVVCQEAYEITGDTATNDDHYGPAKARLSDSLLLQHYEICCLGGFDHLTAGTQ